MSAFIHSPQAARSVSLGGLGVVYRLPAADTQGVFVAVEHPLQPQTLGSPVHTHTREDEYSFILEGQVTFMLGDEVFTASPGDWVVKPRNIPHCFWNAKPQAARILEIISPPGFEKYFDEMAEIAASTPMDFGRIPDIQRNYGLISDFASLQELTQKYHLQR
jgi:quercetin dioxygenase-like cupin family protein